MEFSKRKCEESSDDDRKGKRFRVAETTRISLKLADLIEDVLEKIFSYLHKEDLVNVVKSDKRLLNSCRQAFRRRYKTEYIVMPWRDEPSVSDVTTKECFSRSKDLIRYFGKNISKLEVKLLYEGDDGDIVSPMDQRIFNLMVKHCRETLTEIKLWEPMPGLEIKKCFTNVKTLAIYHGDVDESVLEIHKWFPKLQNLIFDCVYDLSTCFDMTRTIPSLKSFSLNFSDEAFEEYRGVGIQDLNRFIERNPQLNELNLTLDEFNIGTNQQLFTSDRLHEHIIPGELLTVTLNIPFDEFHYEDLKVLELLQVPIDRIAHLHVKPDVFTEQICKYIQRCVNLKTLKLDVNAKGFPDYDPFKETGWIDATKHELLTHLEISIDIYTYTDHHIYYSKVGLSATRPYLQSRNLSTIKFSYTRLYAITKLDPKFVLPAMDIIRSEIDRKKWSFTHEISEVETSFTIIKL